MTEVALTDENGNETGTMDLLEAHKGNGVLHRAFSIFIFSKDGAKILLQKRSDQKQLWPLCWSNTCCSHPKPGEDDITAGERRLKEECGFTCPLKSVGSFVYQAEDPKGKGSEYEYDTVLIGIAQNSAELNPDPSEIADLKWISLENLRREMQEKPKTFTPWFFIGLKMIFCAGASPS
jgi:isopentenyl-diphosphate Delta-isomerase